MKELNPLDIIAQAEQSAREQALKGVTAKPVVEVPPVVIEVAKAADNNSAGEPVPALAEASGTQAEKRANPEAPADLSKVLNELRGEILGIINNIKTPEEYASFRKGMYIIPAEEGQIERRYFFHMDTVKKRIRRRIAEEETPFVAALTKELEEKTREKFRLLKESDLKMQFDREQTKIDEAKDEPALIKLKKAWERKLNITLPWEEKAVFNNLFPTEQDIVKKDYVDCAAALSRNLHEKLRRPRIEIKNQFNKVVREKRQSAKELFGDSSDETSQRKYADYMNYLKQLGREADFAFEKNDIEELNRALRAVNEVKFIVEEEGGKSTRPVTPEKRKEHSDEELFSALVKFLQPKLPFTFSHSENGGKLVIVSASDGVIKYRQNENKAIIRIAPKNIKNFLQFLDNSFGWKLRMPRAKEKKAVSVSAKPVGTSGAEEVESKNLKEKSYEELETFVTKAKKKQYESVVTEGIAPFVEYMEQNPTLTFQVIISNDQYGGVENVARELAEELEVILPSTWSDADRKLFAFVFTKKQIEDLFE